MILSLPDTKLVPVVATTAEAEAHRPLWVGMPKAILDAAIHACITQIHEDARLARWRPMRATVITAEGVRRAIDWLDWRGQLMQRDWLDTAPISRVAALDWPRLPKSTTAEDRQRRAA